VDVLLIYSLVAFAAKRLWNNGLLILSTAFGLLVAATLVTAIPMFAEGISELLLKKELEKPNLRISGLPASAVQLRHFSRHKPNEPATTVSTYLEADNFYSTQMSAIVGLEETIQVSYLQTDVVPLMRFSDDTESLLKARGLDYGFFVTIDDQNEHVKLLEGRLPESIWDTVVEEGSGQQLPLIEAMMINDSLDLLGYLVGDRVKTVYKDINTGQEFPIAVDIVGRFVPEDESSDYWFYNVESAFDRGAMFVNRDLYLDRLLKEHPGLFYEATWYSDFNPDSINAGNYRRVTGGLYGLRSSTNNILPNTKLEYSPEQIFAEFENKLFFLQLLLLILSAPVVAIVLYYISLSAGMVVDRQRSEIAILKSRGVGTLQITGVYLLEGMIIGAFALAIGPLLALGMAQIVGKTYTFLVFTNRESLPIDLSLRHYMYAGGAILLSIAATLVPAVSAARQSIVEYKAGVSRTTRKPLFQRFFLDIALFALSIYGFISLRNRDSLLSVGPEGEFFSDPLLLVMPVIFIFAVAVLFLRFFPWLVALLAWAGSRWWGVGIHLGLRQIGRSPGQFSRLVLLLILTLALGTFSASMASTIDRNVTDRALFGVGAPAFIEESGEWDEENEEWLIQPVDVHENASTEDGDPLINNYARFWEKGGDGDAKFEIPGRGAMKDITVYGIDPVPFAKTTFWRRDFSIYDLNSLANALAGDERALLADKSYFGDQLRYNLGDPMVIRFGQTDTEFFLSGWIDSFPTHYPEDGPFVVGNLDYIHRNIGESPWDVLIQPANDASATELANSLKQLDLHILDSKDARVIIQDARDDATQIGTFGVLTAGFVISTILTLLGFLLYSFFSFRRRLQQFGILRAMGLSVKQMIGLFMFENGFLIGLGTLIGTILGIITGKMFIPFLQLSADQQASTPAFVIETAWGDIAKIYMLFILVLAIAVPISIWMLRNIRIHEAMKFGEETG